MAKFAQGTFVPKNTQKYVGKHTPRYRSGWELTYWASEAISVPYRHPFTGQHKNYIPDFFVVYENKYGKKIAEVVEIKPKKQSLIESKVANARDRAIVAINHAKWQAAMAYCKHQGYTFRVITEDDLFYNGRSK